MHRRSDIYLYGFTKPMPDILSQGLPRLIFPVNNTTIVQRNVFYTGQHRKAVYAFNIYSCRRFFNCGCL
jgi:hypothetical protein